MNKLITVIALASSMGLANAEPVSLTDGQMDQVSAGGTAWSFAGATAIGNSFATTETITYAEVLGLVVVPTQGGHILVDTGVAMSSSFASAL
ncbi:MAG: hypothetical protein K9L22_13205 [Methylococcaceae bacterium]|nr:hypothetical protein [Methylococcaceae bacterium]